MFSVFLIGEMNLVSFSLFAEQMAKMKKVTNAHGTNILRNVILINSQKFPSILCKRVRDSVYAVCLYF